MNTVLVATERDLEHNVLAQALDGQGYQIVRSRDGVDALEVARQKPPQILLVNVSLPKLDGFALFRRIQQDEQLRQIPVVLFSTRSNDQKSERFAQELGATQFVGNALKPGALDGVLDAARAAATPPLPMLAITPKSALVTPQVAAGHAATLKLPTLPEAANADSLEQALQARQLRQTLQTTQQQLQGAQSWQALFDISPAAMWLVSKDTPKVLAANEAAARLFGYGQAEFMQLDPGVLRDAGNVNSTHVLAYRSKDQRPLSLLANSRETDFQGQPAELWVAHDVSYRVRGERAMADEVQRVKAILTNLPLAYWVVNTSGQLVDVNAAAWRLLGYSREQFIEQEPATLFIDPRSWATVRALAAAESTAVALRHSDGSARKVEYTAGQNEFGAGLRVLTLRALPDPITVELPALAISAPKLPAVLEMLRYAVDADETTLLQYAMAQLAHVFNSPLALFAAVERVTQTVEICATSDGQTKRRMTGHSVAIPGTWRQLLTPRTLYTQTPDAEPLTIDGLPDLAGYMACSSGNVRAQGRELWFLIIANRDTEYSADEQRQLQDCADILVSLLGLMRQQFKLQAAATRSAAATDNMVALLEKLLDHHDVYAAGSGMRVANLAVQIARQLNLSTEQQAALALAGRLHDIGHLRIPQSLLLSPHILSEAERLLMQTHVEQGVSLLNGVNIGIDISNIIAQHHERLDGSGYPAGLQGEQICMEARVLAVADVVDAMCSARAHRPASGWPAVRQELRTGARYDAQVVAACEKVLEANATDIRLA